MRIERMVVGVDFSAGSVEAAQWAARYLGSGSDLVLLHVISIPDVPPIIRSRFPRRDLLLEIVREGAEKRLREITSSLTAGRVWLEIREGDPVECITGLADEFAADLVVAGSRSDHRGLKDRLGSTAEHLVRSSARPVLVVARPRPRMPSRILVAVENPENASESLACAGALSQRFDAQVIAMHVATTAPRSRVRTPVPATSGASRGDYIRREDDAEEPDPWVEAAVAAGAARELVHSEIVVGDVTEELLNASERLDVDLVVIGRHRMGRLRRALRGSVMEQVLRSARCAVLAVPEIGGA